MRKRRFTPLPDAGYVRLSQIIGDPEATPPTPAFIPISAAQWWKGVKEGRFPQPVKLGPRTTAWKVEDVRALRDAIDGTASQGETA